ncbi:MAG TPA: ice-binding family protein [Bacteriovoracaceae bacterium]|nr:ice-binding family protein [Bacteriovoracaceae bacterium]
MNFPSLLPSVSHKACFALSFSLLLAASCGKKDSDATNNPRNPFGAGPASISLSKDQGTLVPGDLGSAGYYVIMAKTGVSNGTGSSITGHLAVSPAAATYFTGFSPIADASGTFSTSPGIVTGRLYAADYSAPTPSNLTTAIGSMETSYTDAAGRTNPDFNELASGSLGGLTLAPGLYKWSSSVGIPTAVTIAGSATDVWIFQIAGNLSIDAGISVILSGGALAKNIFWQVAGSTTILSTAHMEGIILCKTNVAFLPNATLNGRVFAQTAVTLNNNTINQR